MEIKGKYNNAVAFLNELEQSAIDQIIEICDQEFLKDAKIRIMSDAHSGNGCVIGTTLTITDKIVPYFVGVDVSCGVLASKLSITEIDLEQLDFNIRRNIPHGFTVYNKRRSIREFDLKQLKCYDSLEKLEHLECSLGTLGGGNHFIEIDKDLNGDFWLLVHTGSRNLGLQVAEIYQEIAYKKLNPISDNDKEKIQKIVNELVLQRREKEIEKAIKEFHKNNKRNDVIKKDLSYLEGQDFDNYLYDMAFCQKWAKRNREIISEKIAVGIRCDFIEQIDTVHNYIDIENMILRKGAVSSQKDEMFVIPINMRDGTLLCKGKGNPDWNFSAPHGAGRLMSRNKAFEKLSMEDFENSMKGVFTTCVSKKTLDESPMAYKPIDAILQFVNDTLEVIDVMKPIYNFKSA